jgi:hypothetical protein
MLLQVLDPSVAGVTACDALQKSVMPAKDSMRKADPRICENPSTRPNGSQRIRIAPPLTTASSRLMPAGADFRIDGNSGDDAVQAVRLFNDALAADTCLSATAIQTVGVKGNMALRSYAWRGPPSDAPRRNSGPEAHAIEARHSRHR